MNNEQESQPLLRNYFGKSSTKTSTKEIWSFRVREKKKPGINEALSSATK